MKLTALLPVLAVSLLFASTGRSAGEGHVLARKGGLPAAGTARTEALVHEMTDAVLTLKMGEQEIPGTMSRMETTNEVVEGLSPTKARRILASKTTEQRVVVMEQEQPGPEEADPLQGLPVILEEKDGKWTAVLEEGEATDEQKAALVKVAKEQSEDSHLAIYGDTPRKPGDKWDVDPKTLPNFAGAGALSGSFAAEFVEVKEVKGTPCAVLKFTMDLTGTTVKEGDSPAMNIKMKGELQVHRSLADLVDIESKMTATMTVEGSPTPEVKMKVTGPVTLTGSTTVGKK